MNKKIKEIAKVTIGKHKIIKIKNLSIRLNKELNIHLENNKAYKNKHKNERCFIIGNGPSTNEQDLSLLQNEIVFTVNQIAKNKQFSNFKTTYHFWADPLFFKLNKNNPEEYQVIQTMKDVHGNNPNVEIFYPYYNDAKNFILDNDLQINSNVNYFYTTFELESAEQLELDFSKPITGFHTVVQYAVAMAIYMGFSEIYILGCETTGFLTTTKAKLKEDINEQDYAYEITESEKQRLYNKSNIHSIEAELNSFLLTFKGYRYLSDYCQSKGIIFKDLTPNGLVEIPKANYEQVVGCKNVEKI